MNLADLAILTITTYQRVMEVEALVKSSCLLTFTQEMFDNLRIYLKLLYDILMTLDTLVRAYGREHNC